MLCAGANNSRLFDILFSTIHFDIIDFVLPKSQKWKEFHVIFWCVCVILFGWHPTELCVMCHSTHFLSLFVLIRDLCVYRMENEQRKKTPHDVNWMIHLHKSHSYVAHANVAPFFLPCILPFFSNHCEFFSSTRQAAFYFIVCVILYVKSYPFQYLFMHGSFVYLLPLIINRPGLISSSRGRSARSLNTHICSAARKFGSN